MVGESEGKPSTLCDGSESARKKRGARDADRKATERSIASNTSQVFDRGGPHHESGTQQRRRLARTVTMAAAAPA
eukprot:6005353-Prymnesium_polylepis.1